MTRRKCFQFRGSQDRCTSGVRSLRTEDQWWWVCTPSGELAHRSGRGWTWTGVDWRGTRTWERGKSAVYSLWRNLTLECMSRNESKAWVKGNTWAFVRTEVQLGRWSQQWERNWELKGGEKVTSPMRLWFRYLSSCSLGTPDQFFLLSDCLWLCRIKTDPDWLWWLPAPGPLPTSPGYSCWLEEGFLGKENECLGM